MPPISADTLYQNGLRDYQTGNYDLAHQEFTDYIRNFPSNDLASNAQFYLGEILYAQGDYKNAVNAYDAVLANYPHSFKLPDSLLKKAMAEQDLSMRTAAIRDYRDVIRRYPGSDASRRASARLRDMGASTTAQRSR
jgi:tol-pal system protein YbgF